MAQLPVRVKQNKSSKQTACGSPRPPGLTIRELSMLKTASVTNQAQGLRIPAHRADAGLCEIELQLQLSLSPNKGQTDSSGSVSKWKDTKLHSKKYQLL